MASPAGSPSQSHYSPDSGSDLSVSPSMAVARRRRKQEEQMEEELAKEGGEENVVVCIRVRPFNRRELELQKTTGEALIRSVIEMPEGMGGKVVALEKNGNDYNVVEEFQYTKSFWSIPEEQQPYPFAPVTQEDVFEVVGKPVLKYAFVGFNNCVFAYGQTGSGKTHTMMGDFTEQDGHFVGDAGLIPRLCRELFVKLDEKRAFVEEGIEKSFDVRLSAIEIYNEQVRDLFWRQTPGRSKNTVLKVRMHPVEGAFVDQLTVLNPTSWQHCVKLIAAGVHERTVAATLMNDESSRSHSVFTIQLQQSETVHIISDNPEDRYSKPVTNVKLSRINLVDLAGSERVKKSGAQGQNLKEASTINQSLSTLKKVIDALVANSKETNVKKHVVIPFRESMLTMLLSNSLGGNAKTTMIACVSPHHDNQEETLLTLRYANRAKGIVNHTRVNEDSAAKQALALKHQILALQKRLADGEDEETEDLLDQLEVGRDALKELEEENKRLESQAAEMKSRTKKEEGARYAAAFYNSLKMVMLQQQTEQLEESIREMEERLARETSETERLRSEVLASEKLTRDQEQSISRLQREESDHAASEKEQLTVQSRLRVDHDAAMKKLHHEMELRYAQKLVNARKLHRSRLSHEQVLAKVQEQHDLSLTSVILQAAEQYEQEVRQYADADSAVSARIARGEREIPILVNKREQLDQQAADLTVEIRNREKAHAARMESIENSWKERYANMKQENETAIAKMEEEMLQDNMKWDSQIDDEHVAATQDQLDAIARMEDKIRQRETEWANKATQSVTDQSNQLDQTNHTLMQKNIEELATLERQLQSKISALVAYYRDMSVYSDELGRATTYIEGQTAPIVKLFDEISEWQVPSQASPDLRAMFSLLHGHETSHRSVKLGVGDASEARKNAFAASVTEMPYQERGGRLRVAVPPVEFFALPTTPAPTAYSASTKTQDIASPPGRSPATPASATTVCAPVAASPARNSPALRAATSSSPSRQPLPSSLSTTPRPAQLRGLSPVSASRSTPLTSAAASSAANLRPSTAGLVKPSAFYQPSVSIRRGASPVSASSKTSRAH